MRTTTHARKVLRLLFLFHLTIVAGVVFVAAVALAVFVVAVVLVVVVVIVSCIMLPRASVARTAAITLTSISMAADFMSGVSCVML